MQVVIIRKTYKQKADQIQTTKVKICDLYRMKYNIEAKLEECSNRKRRSYLLSELKQCLRQIEALELSKAV